METLSKIETNKLIATYRGSIIVQRYHAEWNHLMPVVQKIDKFLDENLLDDFWKAKGVYWRHSQFKLMTIATPIDIVYKRVVEFITWYNKSEKFDFELKPMQIAVYALNCPKEDKYFEEVADLIERYADTKVYNELEAPAKEFDNKVLKILKSMTLSMAAHPDCVKGSEFFDLVSIAEKVLEGTLDTRHG